MLKGWQHRIIDQQEIHMSTEFNISLSETFMYTNYRVVNNDRVTEYFDLPSDNSEQRSHPKELVRNIHNNGS